MAYLAGTPILQTEGTMASQITPNTFLTHCARPSSSSKANTPATTIFFISGNPGLISYYHPFLSLLADQLTVSEGSKPGSSFQVYGCSLGGFELLEDKVQTSKDGSHKPNPKIYGLEDQIHFVHGKLHTLVTENSKTTLSQTRSADAATPPPRQKVILIGHSVGAYIAMEILRRHRETSGSKSVEFDIIGGVMLFPTVMDIAASPSGRKLTTLLSFIPRLALVVGFFARLLTFFLPNPALRSLVRFVMNSPPDHALDATFAFLKSPTGVRQALHMAADEMRTITTDKWADDVWGAATARQAITKLVFYFGRNDHWVAEKTRDEIIALRGQTGGKGPTMLVCEEGLPHAFCLKHNDVMARKVGGMIRDIVAGDEAS